MKRTFILLITIMFICHAGMAQQDLWIQYCVSDEIPGRIGMSYPADMTAAMRFTPEDLAAYGIVSGSKISKVALGLGVNLNSVFVMEIRIWEGGTSVADAGELVYTQPIPDFASFTENAMNEVILTTPFVIDASKELRIGYKTDGVEGTPLGRDVGPAVAGKGDLFFSTDFSYWISIYEEYNMDYNFSIKAFVSKPCEPVKDLSSEIIDNNSILLSWTEPEVDEEIEGYNVFRNDIPLTAALITTTSYLDDNLLAGEHEYYVLTHYTNGCVSDSSNHVIETVILGIKDMKNGIVIYPNPTTGELTITNNSQVQRQSTSIEIFDVLSKNASAKFLSFEETKVIDISHLPSGVYFIRISTQGNVFTDKIIKY